MLFISMMGAPGRYDPAVFADQPGGDNEAEWFRLCLRRLHLEQRVRYDAVHACRGEALPSSAAADAVVLGGSYHSVHDGLPWQGTVMAWLAAYRRTARPLLAICGGHQLVAHMLGGTVGALERGPAAGSFPVDLTAEGRSHLLFDGFPAEPLFHFANEERVAESPPDATTLARAPGMPYAALDHGGAWFGVQFHPEATHDCLASSWLAETPAPATSYRPLPEAPRLIRNFLTGTGVVD